MKINIICNRACYKFNFNKLVFNYLGSKRLLHNKVHWLFLQICIITSSVSFTFNHEKQVGQISFILFYKQGIK